MRFLLCGGRLRVDVVELGSGRYEVFVFVGGGVCSVFDVLRDEGFDLIFSEDGVTRVMSKVVSGNVIDYLTELSVKVATEMKKWH